MFLKSINCYLSLNVIKLLYERFKFRSFRKFIKIGRTFSVKRLSANVSSVKQFNSQNEFDGGRLFKTLKEMFKCHNLN